MGSNDQKLVDAIADMEEEEAMRLTREMIDAGREPADILASCKQAMDIVGRRFEEQEYFIPELVMAGEMLDQIGALVKPLIKGQVGERSAGIGTMVLGTVHGDLHDIGKNIVGFMLDVNGIEVVDIGVDAQPQKFIDAIREHKPEVVGLSGFLTLAFDSMKETVEAITEAGLRDQVKITIGGGQVDEAIRVYTGADAFGLTAMKAVAQCKEWMAQ